MRRTGFVTDFYRAWASYQRGFGLQAGEHWLGKGSTLLTYPNLMKLLLVLTSNILILVSFHDD